MDTAITALNALCEKLEEDTSYARSTYHSAHATLTLLKKEEARQHRIDTFVEMLMNGRRTEWQELSKEARWDWKHSDYDDGEEDALYWHDTTLLQEAFMIWVQLTRAPVGLSNEPVSVDRGSSTARDDAPTCSRT